MKYIPIQTWHKNTKIYADLLTNFSDKMIFKFINNIHKTFISSKLMFFEHTCARWLWCAELGHFDSSLFLLPSVKTGAFHSSLLSMDEWEWADQKKRRLTRSLERGGSPTQITNEEEWDHCHTHSGR